MGESRDVIGNLLPFFLVVDVSQSMSGARIDAVNQILPTLVDALAENPILSDKVRFGVIDFSNTATVLTPLCDLLNQSSLPGFSVRGATYYSAAFELLKSQIQTDVDQLKADGYNVYRPTVFFMSDGAPNQGDPWQAPFAELTTYDQTTNTGFKYYPNLSPFGIQGADPVILQQLIHPSTGPRPMKMFLTDAGADAASAIASMAEILLASVLNSVQSVATDDGAGSAGLPDLGDMPDLPGLTAVGPDDIIFL